MRRSAQDESGKNRMEASEGLGHMQVDLGVHVNRVRCLSSFKGK